MDGQFCRFRQVLFRFILVKFMTKLYESSFYLHIQSSIDSYTFFLLRSFENIYIGWGLKAVKPRDFPYCLPRLQTEFLQEIDEIIDPTPEEEQAQKAKDEEGSEAEEGSENDEDDENQE